MAGEGRGILPSLVAFRHGYGLGSGSGLFCPLGKGGLELLTKQGVMSRCEFIRAELPPKIGPLPLGSSPATFGR